MIDFPASPATGQQFTAAGSIWQWDGVKWVPVPSASAANVGRNLIHNGQFRVQQRGTGGWSTNNSYTADRWMMSMTAGSTLNAAISAQSDTSRGQIGDEEAAFILSHTVAGGSAATDFALARHRIENVRRLANKTVTVSFWAGATAGFKVGVNITQVFGSGGSPSASVVALATGIPFSPAGAWARYTATIPVPSVAGKTFGTTAGTDYTELQFWLSAGANFNAQAGNIGVQSGTFNLWGVQLEIGSVATPLEKLDYALELNNSMRFYRGPANFRFSGYSGAAGQWFTGISSPPMRAIPTVTPTFTVQTLCTGTFNAIDASCAYNLIATVSGVGSFVLQGNYTASADL